MRIVVLSTIAFAPPDPGTLPLAVAHEAQNADVVVCVYQNVNGESQAQIVMPSVSGHDVEIFDVV